MWSITSYLLPSFPFLSCQANQFFRGCQGPQLHHTLNPMVLISATAWCTRNCTANIEQNFRNTIFKWARKYAGGNWPDYDDTPPGVRGVTRNGHYTEYWWRSLHNTSPIMIISGVSGGDVGVNVFWFMHFFVKWSEQDKTLHCVPKGDFKRE